MFNQRRPSRRVLGDDSAARVRAEADDLGRIVTFRGANIFGKKMKLPIVEWEVPVAWIFIPVIGLFAGGAFGKLASVVILGGAKELEGLGSLLGLFGSIFLWWQLKKTLGFVNIFAIFMCAAHAANATNSVLKAWEWDLFFVTVPLVLGIIWVFPRLPGWIAQSRGADTREVQQLVCLGTLIVVGFMAQPLTGLLLKLDLYAIILGTNGVLGLGSWGGFVVAALWFLSLWNWTE